MMDEQLRKLLEKMRVVPHEEYLREIEGGAPVICVPGVGFEFPDNLHGHCAMCRCVIHFRPYNATATFKICLNCATRLPNGEAS